VVSFGDEARIDLTLTPFKTQSEEELTEVVMEQRADHVTERVRPDAMGNTHFIAAFEKAKEAFDEAPELPSPRAKAFILLTDGQPALKLDIIAEEYGYPFFENYFRLP